MQSELAKKNIVKTNTSAGIVRPTVQIGPMLSAQIPTLLWYLEIWVSAEAEFTGAISQSSVPHLALETRMSAFGVQSEH